MNSICGLDGFLKCEQDSGMSDYDHMILHRIDPDQNMWRFFEARICYDLFGIPTLERTHGRIGTFGRTTIRSFATVEEAKLAFQALMKRRLKRGYSTPFSQLYASTNRIVLQTPEHRARATYRNGFGRRCWPTGDVDHQVHKMTVRLASLPSGGISRNTRHI